MKKRFTYIEARRSPESRIMSTATRQKISEGHKRFAIGKKNQRKSRLQGRKMIEIEGPDSAVYQFTDDHGARRHRQPDAAAGAPQSGNPARRSKGSRNKLKEAFLKDLCAGGNRGNRKERSGRLRSRRGLSILPMEITGEDGEPIKVVLIKGDENL
jgi:hypothetical protein